MFIYIPYPHYISTDPYRKCEMEKTNTIEEFLTRSELSQHDEGDCLPSEFESQLPAHVKLNDRPLGT